MGGRWESGGREDKYGIGFQAWSSMKKWPGYNAQSPELGAYESSPKGTLSIMSGIFDYW